MPSLSFRNNLYRTKLFWQLRKWLNEKPVFLFWVNMFHGHYKIDNAKNYARILQTTIIPFLGAVIYGIFIIIIFESFNKFVPIKSDFFDTGATDSLLTAVASIMGVFLGLYFAAISSIASNFLVRATQDVRNFFLTAPAGMQYIRTIAITGIVSVFYLFVKTFGHTIHPFGLVFLTLLAAYVIIRFWSVGSSVFNSMEPGSSFPYIMKDIADSIKDVTPPGFQWDRPFLQNHRRRLVTYRLDLLNNLVNFGITELKLPNNQLLIALRHIEIILLIYAQEKGKIPTSSFWYEEKNQFEDWAFANSTNVILALNTGTTIQPKSIKDFLWFEKRNLDVIIKILKKRSEKNDISTIYQGCEKFNSVTSIYAQNLDEPALKLFFEKFEDIFLNTKLEKEKDPVAQKEQLAFIETQGRLATSAVLGLIRHLDEQTCDKISNNISELNWGSSNKDFIYSADFPSAILPRLEEIAENLENEKLIEDKIISPKWYIKTLCLQKYLYTLQKCFDYLKALHDNYFQPKLKKLLVENQFLLAAHLLLTWSEFSNKYSKLVDSMRKQVESCNKIHLVKDLPFPDFDFDQEEKNASDRESDISNKMILLLPKLKDIETEADLPDYFGQALTIGLETCYKACKEGNIEKLKGTFPIIFNASLDAHNKIRKKVENWDRDDSKIIYSTEPIANILELSGYILLYSELYQNAELWNFAKRIWNDYLQVVDAKQAIQFIVAVAGYRSSLYVIMPQAFLRTNWQMDFSRKMKEHGLPVFPDDRYYGRRKKIDHPSPLIRVITKWGGLTAFSAQEVFFAIYLSNNPAAEDIVFPDKRELKEEIEKENEKNESDEDYED